MPLKPNRWIISSLFFLMAIVWGCNPDDICLSNQYAVQAGFYSYYTGGDSIIGETTVFGVGNNVDSIYNKVSAQKLFLPLSFDGDTTSFLVYDRTRIDTVRLVHGKELIFISRRCGFTFNYTIDTVLYSNTFIDSVSVVNRNVKYNENIENIEIYLY
ncbi:MAG: hypothetical protein LBV41_05885 [Cytophagaceae bacterium]|nr:hypothetical protein [Cytophagaceae bacterium]